MDNKKKLNEEFIDINPTHYKIQNGNKSKQQADKGTYQKISFPEENQELVGAG